MLNWLGNAVGNFTGWVGSGIASFLEWLFGGLVDMVTIIIDATNGIWSVFEALWNLGGSFVGALGAVFGVLFPFAPTSVTTTISAGLIAVLIAGIVHKVRGK